MTNRRVESGQTRQPANNRWRSIKSSLTRVLPLGLLLTAATSVNAQDTVEWTHLGGAADHARYSPAANITA